MKSGVRDNECFDYSGAAEAAHEHYARRAALMAVEGALAAGEAAAELNRAMAGSIAVLIDPRPLTRTSISRLLAGGTSASRRTEDMMVWPVASLEEFLSIYPADGTEVAVAVFNLGGECPLDEEVQTGLARLGNRFPDIPQVLLSDCANPAHILAALRGGVRGYVPGAAESAMVIQGIRLVVAGGMFVPPNVLASVAGADCSGAAAESLAEDGGGRLPSELTPRQSEVFDLLRQGKSNKLIAYDLGMQESTVKVHVRQIMRKLKAINRTHAVFLANNMARLNAAN